MLKLYCVTGTKPRPGDPIINGHQKGEMILEEAKDISPADVARLQLSIFRCRSLVEDVYRINAVKDSAKEFKDTLSDINSDNVEACLTADRRLRSYVLEFDMFLDYWEAAIAHYKRVDGATDDALTQNYNRLFKNLTSKAYDNHVEYRLLDLIRNQTAHVQSPVNRIHVGLDENEAYSSRDILLSKCKNGSNKKKILQAQAEEIELSPIVDVTEKCLLEIHAGLIDFQIDDLVEEELGYIGGFIDYIFSKDLFYQPWLLMDTENIVPNPYHIRDMSAYGYLLERLDKRERNNESNERHLLDRHKK